MGDGLDDFRAALNRATEGYGQRSAWCKANDISTTTFNDVLSGRIPPSRRILQALGWTRRWVYEPEDLP